MTANRQKCAWIWLAVAAITVATLARAEAGLPKATALTHPVLQFLSAHTQNETSATNSWSRRAGSAHTHNSSQQDPGSWTVFLPVFFIGLVAPLNLVSPRASRSLGRSPSAPVLPFLFQRPPPSFLF